MSNVFEYAGIRWDCWHEATDPAGAEKALMFLFDIDEDDIENNDND